MLRRGAEKLCSYGDLTVRWRVVRSNRGRRADDVIARMADGGTGGLIRGWRSGPETTSRQHKAKPSAIGGDR